MRTLLGVRVGDSKIKNAGAGLFATRDFSANERIIRYDGERLSEKQVNRRYGIDLTAPYTIQAEDGSFLDAACKRGIGAFANGVTEKSNRQNCRYESQGKNIFIVATREITAGQELIVDYGPKYRIREKGVTFQTLPYDRRYNK